ncbi:hypothetical protein BDZ89DRAFT_1062376 [Hymenopellis radicata]|nr:hypothetical protein BDZ89DRAFT_1062376 [Hymenopellis radicata]
MAPITTISSLPPELLSSIFLFTVSHSPLYELHSRSSRTSFVLSHVSRYFRVVAHSLPPLWDNILVNPGLLSPLKDPAALLEHVLGLSSAYGRRGITFSWRVSIIKTNPLHMSVLRSLFVLLLAHSHLWRSAELELPVDIAPLLARVRGRVDKLEELNLACYSNSVGVVTGFEGARALKKLGLLGSGFRMAFPKESVRWIVDRRQGLGAAELEVEDMPQLERLESIEWSTRIGEEIRLEGLRSMIVSDAAFSGTLVVPSLTELTLRPNRHGDSDLQGALRAVEASGCALRTFTATPNAFLLPILDLSPSLEELNLSFSAWQNDHASVVRQVFARMAQEPRFLPRLERLAINRCERPIIGGGEDAECFLGSGFMDMLSTRTRSGSALKSVTIDVWGMVSRECWGEEKLKRLRSFREGGLDLCLRANDFGESKRFI